MWGTGRKFRKQINWVKNQNEVSLRSHAHSGKAKITNVHYGKQILVSVYLKQPLFELTESIA